MRDAASILTASSNYECKLKLFCGDPVSNSLVSGTREDAFLEQVVFVAIGAVGNNFAGRGAIDSRKIQELAFGGGVEIDQRMLAVGPTVMDPFGGRSRIRDKNSLTSRTHGGDRDRPVWR